MTTIKLFSEPLLLSLGNYRVWIWIHKPKIIFRGGIDGYELHFIKQPGTDLIPLKTLVEFPDDVIAKGEQINSFGNGVVEFDDNLKTDKIFKLYFSKE